MTIFLKTSAASVLMLTLVGCVTTTQPTLQTRLNHHIGVISTVEAELAVTHDLQARSELLQRRLEAVRAGAALLSQAQAERLARDQSCIERERYLPADAQTCFGESTEDTEARMLAILVKALAEGEPAR